MAILLIFLALQVSDAATTLAFLGHGVPEGNPLLAAVLRASSPAVTLTLAKLGACGLGLYAWRSGRLRLLRRANLFFGACVAWNLIALWK
jgi:zinc transporter ZupT